MPQDETTDGRKDAEDSAVESSFFLAGIAVIVVGFGTAAYFTRLIQHMPIDAKTSVSLITWVWILMLISAASLNVYLFFLFGSYRRKMIEAGRTAMEREALIDFAPVGIFTYGRKGNIDSINQEMASMWGMDVTDVVGKRNVYDYAPFKEAVLTGFFEKCFDGLPREIDAEIRGKDSKKRWYGIHTGPIMSPDRQRIERVLVMIEDISERKRLEAERAKFMENLEEMVRQRTGQLFEAQKRLFAILDHAPVVLWATDKKMVMTLSMGKGLTGLKVEPGEHVGSRIEDIYKDYPQMIENHRRALNGEESSAIVRMAAVTYFSHFAPLKNDKGEITGVIGVALDITDRMKEHELLRESEERYRMLLEMVPYAIFLQTEGKFNFINSAGARLFGAANPEELVGTPVLDRVLEDNRDLAKERERRLHEGPAGTMMVDEQKWVKLDGTVFDSEVKAAHLDLEGKPSALYIVRDKAQTRLR